MTYRFLLEFLDHTALCLDITCENRIFKLTLDFKSYSSLMNDLNSFTDVYSKFELEKLSTPKGIVYIECLENLHELYIKLESKQ